MIKLLRGNRHQMVTENKFIRYIAYALGEIVLVVIGIIIAFMLDDWHVRRILEKEKQQYLEAMINDYTLDSLALADYIERGNNIERQLETLNERAYQPDANLDTLIAIAHDYIPRYNYINTYNTTTLKTIESTGKFELFDMDLRARILKHYQYQNLIIEGQKLNVQSIVRKVDEYTDQYKIGGNRPEGKHYLLDLSWSIENERAFAVLFTEMIGINRMIIEEFINEYEDLLTKTEEMLVLLRTTKSD
ncbi:MAG: hypothetical protein ACWGNV_13035 [Bacteroidales bacterium]